MSENERRRVMEVATEFLAAMHEMNYLGPYSWRDLFKDDAANETFMTIWKSLGSLQQGYGLHDVGESKKYPLAMADSV